MMWMKIWKALLIIPNFVLCEGLTLGRLLGIPSVTKDVDVQRSLTLKKLDKLKTIVNSLNFCGLFIFVTKARK